MIPDIWLWASKNLSMILSKERERQNRKIFKEGGSCVWNLKSMTIKNACFRQSKSCCNLVILPFLHSRLISYMYVIRSHKNGAFQLLHPSKFPIDSSPTYASGFILPKM